MAYLGENFTIAPDGTTVESDPTLDADYGMATIAPSVDYGAAALPGEMPAPDDPCRDCPPKIIYRDKIVDRIVRVPVTVPGPTIFQDRIVYIDRTTGQQVGTEGGDPSSNGQPIYYGISNGFEAPVGEQGITEEGAAVESKSASGIPWWMLALGAAVFLMKR